MQPAIAAPTRLGPITQSPLPRGPSFRTLGPVSSPQKFQQPHPENDDVTGAVGCLNKTDSRCRGLIPKGNTVIARYDVNDSVGSESLIFVWLTDTGTKSAYLQCADELQISTTIKHKKVNVIDPATLGGIGQCVQAGQSRGVLRFVMPGTGFLWSHISQQGQNFRMNFMGYNLDVNPFIP